MDILRRAEYFSHEIFSYFLIEIFSHKLKSRTDPCSEGSSEGEPGGGQTTGREGAEPGTSREEVRRRVESGEWRATGRLLLIRPNTR